MTGHEKIAARNIRNCFNYEIGGMYNAFLDGENDFPTLEEAKDLIYILSIQDRYGPGCCFIGQAPREMRFAGKEFCLKYIDKLFDKDEDVAEIPWRVVE